MNKKLHKESTDIEMSYEEAEKSVLLEYQLGFNNLEEIAFFSTDGDDVIVYIHENDLFDFIKTVEFQEYKISVEDISNELIEGAYDYGEGVYGVGYITITDKTIKIRIYNQKFNIGYVMKKIM